MNARYLIYASLGAMLVLVGALIFASGDGRGPEPGDAVPTSEASRADMQPGAVGPAETAERPDTASPDEDPGPAANAEPAGTGDDPAAVDDENGGRAAAEADPEGAADGASAGAGSAPVAQDPSVPQILRATSERYEGVGSLQADFEQRLRNTLLGTTSTSRGTLYQRAPDRFLMRFSDPDGDVIVSDGSHFWMYFPSTDAGQVIRTRRGAQGLDLQAQFIGDPVERFESTYHGREAVRRRTAHVITLTPRQPLGYQSLKVWIDAEDHLVRRFELTEDNGTIRHFELSDLRVNPTLPDRLFEFTPPEGAHVIDRG